MNENNKMLPTENNIPKLSIIILALIGIGLFSYCIFGAFALFAPPQTLSISPTNAEGGSIPTPSKKAQALMDESAKWAVVFDESFDSDTNVNGWNYGEASIEQMDSVLEIKDGKYKWEVSTKDRIFVRLNPRTAPDPKNFRVSADVKLTSGTYKPVYGIVFRNASFDDYYSFGIYGESFLIEKNYGDQFTRFVDSQKSQAISPQESNRLTVIGKGSFFVFLINDQYVYELMDSDIKNGGFGYGIGLYHADLHNTFEFDNFIIQAP
ncbi:MAG: hypothetical protein Fur0017_04570 [Anaerolineales bacterium]